MPARTGCGRWRAVSALVVVGGVGIALAALTGPWLLRVGFGEQYHASGALLAWLTAGAVVIAVLTVTGAATVARRCTGPTRWLGVRDGRRGGAADPAARFEARTIVALVWAGRWSASPYTWPRWLR